jgi:hypothetical protein
VTSSSGEELRFPAGAVSQRVNVRLTGLSQADVELALGRPLSDYGFAYVGGIHLEADVAGFLAPAAMSVPNRLAVSSTDIVLVAELVPDVDDDARSDLLLVEIARGAGPRVQTASPPFPGIVQPGRFVMLRPAEPWRFMVGTVVTGQGAPLPGAIVATREAPYLRARTGPAGAYVLAAPAALPALTVFATNQPRTAFGLLRWHPQDRPALPPSELPPIEASLTFQGLQLAEDFQNKCPTPDSFLKDALQQIWEGLVERVVTIAESEGIPIEPTPATLVLPTASHDTLRIDFKKHLLPAGGGPVEVTLSPYGLRYKITLLDATVVVWHPQLNPISSNPSVVSVGPWFINDSGVARMEITGHKVGWALIHGSVPAVGVQLVLTYSFEQESGEHCPQGETAPFEMNLASSAGPSLHLAPDSVTVLAGEIDVVPGFAQLSFGKALQLSAVAPGDPAVTLESGVEWSSTDTTVAVVNAEGLVMGRWPAGACTPAGRNCPIGVTIRASHGTARDSALLRIGPYNVTVEGVVREQDPTPDPTLPPGVRRCSPTPVAGATVGTSLDAVTATTDGAGRFFLATDTPVSSDSAGRNYSFTPYAIRVSAPGYQPTSSVYSWGAFPTGQTFCLPRQ